MLFDLDGVIYLGPIAVPGAAEGIALLRGRGIRVGFVTNNAARPPQAVAEHLVEIGIDATAADVVTSAQAGAHLVLNRFGVGAKVLLVGGEGVADAVSEAGDDRRPVRGRRSDRGVQGYGFDLTFRRAQRGGDRHPARGALGGHEHRPDPADRSRTGPGNGAAVAAVG